MAIYLDDEPAKLKGSCLAEILAAATDGLAGDGRVVVEVQLNGKVLNGDELGEHRDTLLDDAELRLTSADPRALAVSTLLQVRDVLPHAGELHEQAAEKFQQDNPTEALKYVAEAIEVWMQVQEAVLGSAGILSLSLDEVKVDGEPMTGFTEELIGKLHGLKDLITAGDTVGMADALAYEWPPLVGRWEALIDQLIKTVEDE
jgi:hypothetical protein